MRYNQPCVCGRSSSGRARPCQGRGSEFEPRRPLQKEYPIRQDGVFFLECAAAPENSLPRPARSASNQEVRQGSCEWRQPFVGCREASSSLVARSKNTTRSGGVFSCAPQRSPSCQPAAGGYRSRQPGHFLESASLHPPQAALRRFPRRPLQKEYPIRQDGVFFLECAAAPENSLPRPARSASNQEVRQDTGDPCVKETLRRSMYVVENGRHCLHVTYKRVLEKRRKSL